MASRLENVHTTSFDEEWMYDLLPIIHCNHHSRSCHSCSLPVLRVRPSTLHLGAVEDYDRDFFGWVVRIVVNRKCEFIGAKFMTCTRRK